MSLLEKLETLNLWSLIGILLKGVAIFISVTKGFIIEKEYSCRI